MTRILPQRGATLVIALIMLVLLTLFAVSALNTGTTDLKVIGNMQARSEAMNAAEQTIETVISRSLFITSPANAVLNPCGAANTLCTDINNDGVTDYTTKLNPQPACVKVDPIKNADLNMAKKVDRDCAVQQQQQFGVAGAVSGNSLCANSIWEITAETTSAANGATAAVTQGIGVRISTDVVATACP